MAPNSSVFNEAPTEAKPPSAPETAMPPATDSRPVTAVSATSTSTATTTSTECSTSSASKQAAPKMEATVVEDQDAETARFDSAAPFRFNRVMPVGLDDAKKTMTFRKSCLKRSSSFLPSSFQEMPVKPIEPEAMPEPEQPKEPDAPVQKNRRRCWECKAKVGLTALTCRCDYTFCSKHRYAEEHNCRFNFKSAAKRKLEDENPRIVPAKVARIN